MRPTWESWVKVMKYIWSVSEVHFIESCSWIRFVTTNWWCWIVRIVKERDALWCLCWKSPSLSLKRWSKHTGEPWGFLAFSWGGIDGNTSWSVRMYLQTPASPTRLGAHWHPHELTLPFCSKRGRFSTCAVQYCPITNRPQVYKSIMFFLANRPIVVFRSHLACCAGLFGYFLGWWEDWTNRHGPLRQTGAQDCLEACSRGSDVE